MLIFLLIFFIVIGFFIIGAIVVRKFPQLSNIDIDQLPKEREVRKKREIIARRIESEGTKIKEVWGQRMNPVKRWWGRFQLRFRIYVGQVERLWHHEEGVKRRAALSQLSGDGEQKLQELIKAGANYLHQGNYEQAESVFISAIKFNAKSADAYRGLADTYFAQGALTEAGETYQFLLQLAPHDDMVMSKLAEVAEAQGQLEEAINWYQQSAILNDSLSPRFFHLAELLLRIKQPETAKEAIVQAIELEPKNPKYLDLLIEIGILCGDKTLAEQGFNELRLVNPDNQKLQVFQERIKEL